MKSTPYSSQDLSGQMSDLSLASKDSKRGKDDGGEKKKKGLLGRMKW